MPNTDPRGGRISDGLRGIVKDRVAKRAQSQIRVERALFATLDEALPARIEAAREAILVQSRHIAVEDAERNIRTSFLAHRRDGLWVEAVLDCASRVEAQVSFDGSRWSIHWPTYNQQTGEYRWDSTSTAYALTPDLVPLVREYIHALWRLRHA